MKIHIVNGPNLNLIEKRPGNVYGGEGFGGIAPALELKARQNGCDVVFYQSNHEGELIDYLQKLTEHDALILNGGAFTHTSLAIADCLEYVPCFKLEVHLSNIYAREPERQKNFFAPHMDGMITGIGLTGYMLALEHILTKKA